MPEPKTYTVTLVGRIGGAFRTWRDVAQVDRGPDPAAGIYLTMVDGRRIMIYPGSQAVVIEETIPGAPAPPTDLFS